MPADALVAELLLQEPPVTFLRAVSPLFSSAGSAGQRVFGHIVLVAGPVMVRVAHGVHICSSSGSLLRSYSINARWNLQHLRAAALTALRRRAAVQRNEGSPGIVVRHLDQRGSADDCAVPPVSPYRTGPRRVFG
jgi:hypothetical protein